MYRLVEITLLVMLFFAVPIRATAGSDLLLFLPPILASSGSAKNSIPEAFIDTVDVRDEKITLAGHYKDDDGDPFVSALWIVQNDKGEMLYQFSEVTVTEQAMTEKGELTIIFTVTTGTGDRQRTSDEVRETIDV